MKDSQSPASQGAGEEVAGRFGAAGWPPHQQRCPLSVCINGLGLPRMVCVPFCLTCNPQKLTPVFIIQTIMKKEIKVFLIYQKNENCIEKGGKTEFSLFWDLRKLVLQYFFLKKRNSRYINLILLSFPLQSSKFFVFRKKKVLFNS